MRSIFSRSEYNAIWAGQARNCSFLDPASLWQKVGRPHHRFFCAKSSSRVVASTVFFEKAEKKSSSRVHVVANTVFFEKAEKSPVVE